MYKLPAEKSIENIFEFIQFVSPVDEQKVHNALYEKNIEHQIKDAVDGKKSLEVKTFDKKKVQDMLQKLLFKGV